MEVVFASSHTHIEHKHSELIHTIHNKTPLQEQKHLCSIRDLERFFLCTSELNSSSTIVHLKNVY